MTVSLAISNAFLDFFGYCCSAPPSPAALSLLTHKNASIRHTPKQFVFILFFFFYLLFFSLVNSWGWPRKGENEILPTDDNRRPTSFPSPPPPRPPRPPSPRVKKEKGPPLPFIPSPAPVIWTFTKAIECYSDKHRVKYVCLVISLYTQKARVFWKRQFMTSFHYSFMIHHYRIVFQLIIKSKTAFETAIGFGLSIQIMNSITWRHLNKRRLL